MNEKDRKGSMCEEQYVNEGGLGGEREEKRGVGGYSSILPIFALSSMGKSTGDTVSMAFKYFLVSL